MGRLLEALRAETGTRPPAKVAKVANVEEKISRLAGLAAPPATKTTESGTRDTETALRARSMTACEDLPIQPAALFAALDDDDRAASPSTESLRAFAESLAERMPKALPAGVSSAYTRLGRTLAEHPDIRTAVEVVDPDANPVLLAVAVRGAGYVCLKAPRERYDGFKLLKLVHRWNHEVRPK